MHSNVENPRFFKKLSMIRNAGWVDSLKILLCTLQFIELVLSKKMILHISSSVLKSAFKFTRIRFLIFDDISVGFILTITYFSSLILIVTQECNFNKYNYFSLHSTNIDLPYLIKLEGLEVIFWQKDLRI